MDRRSIDWILLIIISPLFFIILFLMSYSFRLLYNCIMNCIETKKSQMKSNTSATTEAIVIIWPTLSPQQIAMLLKMTTFTINFIIINIKDMLQFKLNLLSLLL